MLRSSTISTSPFVSMLLLAFCTLLFVACDSSDPDGSGPDPTGNAGEGTLVLDGVTYDFDVIACDFSGEYDTTHQTVSGRGVHGGEDFSLFVSRNEVSSGGQPILVHTVSFYYDADPTGTNVEAQRMRMNGTWTSLHDEPDAPLIVIQGNTLTASGVFAPTDDTDHTMSGSVTATCTD